jgi:hypothetical protein
MKKSRTVFSGILKVQFIFACKAQYYHLWGNFKQFLGLPKYRLPWNNRWGLRIAHVPICCRLVFCHLFPPFANQRQLTK